MAPSDILLIPPRHGCLVLFALLRRLQKRLPMPLSHENTETVLEETQQLHLPVLLRDLHQARSFQISEKERDVELSSLSKDAASIIAEKYSREHLTLTISLAFASDLTLNQDTFPVQISEKERDVELSSLFKDVASIIAEKCINPKTQRPYTITMIERALRDCHFSVDPKRSAKQQALQARALDTSSLSSVGTL